MLCQNIHLHEGLLTLYSANKATGVFSSSATRCPCCSRGWDLCAGAVICNVCVSPCMYICAHADTYVCVCVCVSMCVTACKFLWECESLYLCVWACVPLCITNCNPQQTGTKILALWAVWLKLFMLCHCELSSQPYRLCAVTVKRSQKHAPCRAMLCVVACPLHVTVASYFLHVTVKSAPFLSHTQRERLNATIISVKNDR